MAAPRVGVRGRPAAGGAPVRPGAPRLGNRSPAEAVPQPGLAAPRGGQREEGPRELEGGGR